jgi:phosphatidylglycerol---prolipoprotein diacylglyceryl transferase
MRRILFRWRGVTVWSYPAMLYVGLVAGVVAGNVAAHVVGIDAFRAYVATLVLIPLALVGARLLHVASYWRLYRRTPRRIWDRNDAGFAMYGGLPVALLFSVPLLAVLELPFLGFWDVATVTILVGMMFTRIGCLLNGCCAGRPSKAWGSVYLPNHLGVWERRIPTQCLEAGWAAALVASAMTAWRWLPFPGAFFLLATAGYASGRLVLESAREPEPGARRFTVHHAISLAMVVASLAVLIACWPSRAASAVDGCVVDITNLIA